MKVTYGIVSTADEYIVKECGNVSWLDDLCISLHTLVYRYRHLNNTHQVYLLTEISKY